VSLSTDPGYLAKYGIRAVGGPLNDTVVDDSALLQRTFAYQGGIYHLKGTADGGFEYVWTGLPEVPPHADRP
jgi:hypothetical protein